MTSYADDIRGEINNRLMEALKKNQIPWRMPWSLDSNAGSPRNISSKKSYNGINPLLLYLTSLEKTYSSRWWGTYKQFQEVGGQVRKGEKGTRVVYYSTIEKEAKDDEGNLSKKKIFFMKSYTVFNVEQVDGEKLDKYRIKPSEGDVTFENVAPAEAIIAATDAKIVFGGNKALYIRPVGEWPNHTGGDYIRMPNKNQFTEPSEFYQTQFHELAHWSEVRLNWTGTYEMGELIAEITGCYLAAEAQIPNLNIENHSSYLASWLKAMENDPKWIFKATTQASKATNYILSFSQRTEVSEDQLETTE